MDKKYKEAFRGVYFFHFRRKNFQSNLVLVVVLVLESKGLHWHNNKDDNKNLLLEQWGRGGQPDPWIKGGPVSPKLFSVLLASVWSKNKEGGGPPLDQSPVLALASGDRFVSRPVFSFFTFNKPMQHVQFPIQSEEGDREPARRCAITIVFLFIIHLFIYLFAHFRIHLSIYRKSFIKPSGAICSSKLG